MSYGAEAAIAAYAGQSPRLLFRPPYGAWDADLLIGAGAAGYRWTVLWDVDTIDWKPISERRTHGISNRPDGDRPGPERIDRADAPRWIPNPQRPAGNRRWPARSGLHAGHLETLFGH
jgi:peptidoglycan/xylan/chitin deacetylase (PgdA/CDA1 family)